LSRVQQRGPRCKSRDRRLQTHDNYYNYTLLLQVTTSLHMPRRQAVTRPGQVEPGPTTWSKMQEQRPQTANTRQLLQLHVTTTSYYYTPRPGLVTSCIQTRASTYNVHRCCSPAKKLEAAYSSPWNPSQSYEASPAIWGRVLLPAIQHRYKHHTLTPDMQASMQFTYPGGIGG